VRACGSRSVLTEVCGVQHCLGCMQRTKLLCIKLLMRLWASWPPARVLARSVSCPADGFSWPHNGNLNEYGSLACCQAGAGCALLTCWGGLSRARCLLPRVPAPTAVRRRLKPFGCRLAAVRRSAWGGPADAAVEALLDETGAWADLPRLAAAADVLVLACVQVRDSAASAN